MGATRNSMGNGHLCTCAVITHSREVVKASERANIDVHDASLSQCTSAAETSSIHSGRSNQPYELGPNMSCLYESAALAD